MTHETAPPPPAEDARLAAFLDARERPAHTLGYHELQGFLFAVACAPEPVHPADWIGAVFADQRPGFADADEARRVVGWLMALRDAVAADIVAQRAILRGGCAFRPDLMSNFDADAPVARWSQGFALGQEWLLDVWDAHLAERDEDAYAANVMTLSMFCSLETARAYVDDFEWPAHVDEKTALLELARTAREDFSAAMQAHAAMGRELEVRDLAAEIDRAPARGDKIQRNAPCPCGSGRKYKKCCGAPARLH